MMTLYEFQGSGNCYKIRLALAQTGRKEGQDYKRISVNPRNGDTRKPEYLAVNPFGQVPMLVLEDGRKISETTAILWYLASGSDLLPNDHYSQAEVLRWMLFEQTKLFQHLAYPRVMVLTKPDDPATEACIADHHPKGKEGLALLNEHLADHDFVAAGRYTIADIAFYGYVHMAHVGKYDMNAYPAIMAWIERIKSQNGHITLEQ